MAKKVIAPIQQVEKISSLGFAILAGYVQAVQDWRTHFGSDRKRRMLDLEHRAIEFLKNPLIDFPDGMFSENQEEAKEPHQNDRNGPKPADRDTVGQSPTK